MEQLAHTLLPAFPNVNAITAVHLKDKSFVDCARKGKGYEQ
jgi:hypothetical protein